MREAAECDVHNTVPSIPSRTANQDQLYTAGQFTNGLVERSSQEHAPEMARHVLMAYYKIARGRLIDCVTRDVVHYFLLDNDEGPLRALDHDYAFNIDPQTLEMIAGEDQTTAEKRTQLTKQVENLEKAARMLRPDSHVTV